MASATATKFPSRRTVKDEDKAAAARRNKALKYFHEIKPRSLAESGLIEILQTQGTLTFLENHYNDIEARPFQVHTEPHPEDEAQANCGFYVFKHIKLLVKEKQQRIKKWRQW